MKWPPLGGCPVFAPVQDAGTRWPVSRITSTQRNQSAHSPLMEGPPRPAWSFGMGRSAPSPFFGWGGRDPRSSSQTGAQTTPSSHNSRLLIGRGTFSSQRDRSRNRCRFEVVFQPLNARQPRSSPGTANFFVSTGAGGDFFPSMPRFFFIVPAFRLVRRKKCSPTHEDQRKVLAGAPLVSIGHAETVLPDGGRGP